MSERLAALLPTLVLFVTPAAAEPAWTVTVLDVPFKVSAMRGPGSEVALAVATSGLLPIARPKPTSADPKAAASPRDETEPHVVVWGEGGGAALSLGKDGLVTTLLSSEAVEGLAATETPKDAVPGSRRAMAGPLSAYFKLPASPPGSAASLVIRERQPIGVTAEPKPVPVATSIVTPEDGAAFVATEPVIASHDGRPVLVVSTVKPDGSSALAVVAKAGESWRVAALSDPAPAAPGAPPVAVAAVAPLGQDGLRIGVVRGTETDAVLELWTYSGKALARGAQAPGYAALPNSAGTSSAGVMADESGHATAFALPIAGRSEIALVSLADGLRQSARIPLPAPAAIGIAVLGRGASSQIIVGLADGSLARIGRDGAHP